MKKIILFHLLFTFSSYTLSGQGAFDNALRVRNLQKGWHLGGGVFHTRLVNSAIYQSDKLADGSTGLSLGLGYDQAPWGFDGTYNTARVNQSRLKMTLGGKTDTARILMLSASGHFNLLWNSKFFYPYIGAGFQYSSLSSDSISINPTNAFIKAGVKFFLNNHKITVKGEYQRGIPASGGKFRQDDLEVVTISIGFRLHKPKLSNM
jgi:hypothetical protein